MSGELRLRRPDLVVDDPLDLALRFFAEDPSSVGTKSYDAYIVGAPAPNRVVDEDIAVINSTMSARSSHKHWADLISRGDLAELVAVERDWDLFCTPDDIWRERNVPDVLERLFSVVIGKGIAISRATKVLHIKRPALIPVCDSYVLGLMGIFGVTAASGVALIEHLRDLRSELVPTLISLQNSLRDHGHERSLVRIMDALIWSSYPDTRLGRSGLPAPTVATDMRTASDS